MKYFYCVCGQGLFYENTSCTNCGRTVGFDPDILSLISLEPAENDFYSSVYVPDNKYRLCNNFHDYKNCNWLIPVSQPDNHYCVSCRLNILIPNLDNPKNLTRWSLIETAKRRLLYSLLRLKLPFTAQAQFSFDGIRFKFIEDKSTNPNVAEDVVTTGHHEGLITLNVIEADSEHREATRIEMNESYRTLLGHFRHESGHVYWELLIKNANLVDDFRQLFGDESQDYRSALDKYYQAGPSSDWLDNFISQYARSHPMEDWAETWAHFLHIYDTIETAVSHGVIEIDLGNASFDEWLSDWYKLTIFMNALNRSLGMQDAYPFVFSPAVIQKLRFVFTLIRARQFPS